MAQINFSQINSVAGGKEKSSQNDKIGYFSLKNDGDEAIVRIMHDTTNDFEIVTVHQVDVDGRKRTVNCIRDDAFSPIEQCPLCDAQSPLRQKIYIRLIEYSRGSDGSVVAEPKIWERHISYATTLSNLIQEYGPLSDSIFKIKRSGKAGSTDTTYSIMYGNPTIYKPEIFPKKPELFEGFKVVGRVVLNKTFEDMKYFISNGTFPQPVNQQSPQPAPKQPQPVAPTTPDIDLIPKQPTMPPRQEMPWETSQPQPATRQGPRFY